MATIQGYFQPVVNAARNPSSLLSTVQSSAAQPLNMLNQVRSMSSTQWMSVGVVAAEVIGFFTVGEMIGRLRLVGYRAKPEHH
jgi:F-type H+-transporting ATPase subunit g